jgi:hypothetical protein
MSNDQSEHTTDIIVNGRPKSIQGREVTYAQIVHIAFENPPHGAETIFSVTYRKGGNEHRPEGVMVEGDTVKIKKGTTFNVSATNRS